MSNANELSADARRPGEGVLCGLENEISLGLLVKYRAAHSVPIFVTTGAF